MNITGIIEDLETRRKFFHLFALLLWLFPLSLFPFWTNLFLFLCVIGVNLATVFKLGENKLKYLYWLVYRLERSRNYSKPGIQALWANIGIFSVYLLFGKEPAMVSVAVLAVGDAFASLVGIRYGRKRIGNRSLEGSLAFFLASFLVLFPFIGFGKAFLVSLLAAIFEAIPLGVDDNFVVPIVAGLVYYVLL